ncbi:MAG: RIP metalloprotease RseP [Rikenellaceae bacterium]|nr:RIP metalloprotease RseP [Rikenellaceae bacterium]
MDIVIKILQFILSFTLLVLVHEFGHYFFGRLFGVRVEQFRIFFGRALVKWHWGETEFGIGWIPFGGYAKLAGMVDESMDTEQLKSEPQPWEFRTKPAWQRLLIMLGGVMMNAILAFAIYVGISLKWGDTYISNKDMQYGYVFNDYGHNLGFCNGDKIISIGGKEIDDFAKILTTLAIESDKTTVVERDGQMVAIEIPVQSVMEFVEQTDFISPRVPFKIAGLVEGFGAAEAGLQVGDRLVSFNGTPTTWFDEYTPLLEANAGQRVVLGYERGGESGEVEVAVSPEGKIGVGVASAEYIPVRTRNYNLWQAIPRGFERVGEEMSDYWKQLKMIVQPKTEMYKALGGPISIGQIFPNEWNWEYFWRVTALLSVILAIMNVLPIPALDGGHVLFLLIEVITGRKPSDKVLMVAQMIGMALLFALMFYATWNDIARLFTR